jgi:hypothetical protein
MMVSQPPVTYHRVLVDVTGAAMPALMLSACIEQQEEAFKPHGDDWFELNALELEYQTGMTPSEQVAARRVLCRKRVTQERLMGQPARLQMRIDFDQITVEMVEAARKRSALMQASASMRPRVPDHLFQFHRTAH